MTATPNPFRLSSSPSYLVRAIAERNQAILNRALRSLALAPVAWRVLAALNERDGDNIGELAERTATDRSNLSRAVVRLERDGLVERRPAPRDRRNSLVFLTAAGQARFRVALPIVRSVIDASLAGLSPEESETIVALLRRMHVNVMRLPIG